MSKMIYLGLCALGSFAIHAQFNQQEFKQAKSHLEKFLLKKRGKAVTKEIMAGLIKYYKYAIEGIEKGEEKLQAQTDLATSIAFAYFLEFLKIITSEFKKGCDDYYLTILLQPLEDAAKTISTSNGDISVIRQEKEKLKVCLHILEKK